MFRRPKENHKWLVVVITTNKTRLLTGQREERGSEDGQLLDGHDLSRAVEPTPSHGKLPNSNNEARKPESSHVMVTRLLLDSWQWGYITMPLSVPIGECHKGGRNGHTRTGHQCTAQ